MPRLAVLLLAVGAVALSACEDDVDPTLGIDAPFSLYGYLDPTADVQRIRVAPITPTILDDPADLDATVTSTDLGTGQTVTWRDSVVTFADDSRGVVFSAAFSPAPGSTIRIVARRSDGAEAVSEITVPPIVQGDVSPAVFRNGELSYPVQYSGAPRVLSGQLRLTVLGLPDLPDGVSGTLTVPFNASPRDQGDGLWTIDVPFQTATRRELENRALLGRLRLIDANYVAFVANEAWTLPTDDLDAIIEPGTFTNVEGGFGFVGAGYFSPVQWVPSLGAQAGAGFIVEGDPAASLVINEVKDGEDGWVEFFNPLFDEVSLVGYTLSDDQTNPERQRLGQSARVPAQGYFVVNLDFTLEPSADTQEPDVEIGLYDPSRELISRVVLEEIAIESNATFGAFPDGQRFLVPPSLGGFDLFLGPLAPTPGEANELGLTVAVVNEVFSEGATGWVEGLSVAFAPRNLRIMDAADGFFDAVSLSAGLFGVADETPGTFDLSQGGGELYLIATYNDPRLAAPPPVGKPPVPVPSPPQTRVVDVRRYGGQTAGRSVGYLPDGPSGAWSTGLAPTRGAPNASARFGGL